jgi:hypothetical protein
LKICPSIGEDAAKRVTLSGVADVAIGTIGKTNQLFGRNVTVFLNVPSMFQKNSDRAGILWEMVVFLGGY